jgi:hypothetical protein
LFKKLILNPGTVSANKQTEWYINLPFSKAFGKFISFLSVAAGNYNNMNIILKGQIKE